MRLGGGRAVLGLCLPRGGADKPLPGGEGWHGASQPAAWPPRCCHPATSARCCSQAPGADSHPCLVWRGGTWDAGNKSRQPCALLGRSGCGFCPKRYRAGEQQVPGARRVHAALHPEQLLPQKMPRAHHGSPACPKTSTWGGLFLSPTPHHAHGAARPGKACQGCGAGATHQTRLHLTKRSIIKITLLGAERKKTFHASLPISTAQITLHSSSP